MTGDPGRDLPEKQPAGGSASVKSAARILDMMELLSSDNRSWRLSELVAEMAIPKSSGLMLLRTLIARGYAVQLADGSYALRPAYRDASGWTGGRIGLLRQVALPEIRALSLRIGQTAVLGVLTGRPDVRLIETVQSTADIRYEIPPETRFPVFCSAMGRCFLAFGPRAYAEAYFRKATLPKFTRFTVNDPRTIRNLLDQIRHQRYAINIEEHVIGAASVAAPVLDRDGSIIAAINVGCVTPSYFERPQQIIDAVHETGLRISALMQTV